MLLGPCLRACVVGEADRAKQVGGAGRDTVRDTSYMLLSVTYP